MDFYWKTWIQLAFPAYILLLVVLVIMVSEHSVKFAKIVAKKNPLATLNTLILISYVKFLCTIILAFSFATLDYPQWSRNRGGQGGHWPPQYFRRGGPAPPIIKLNTKPFDSSNSHHLPDFLCTNLYQITKIRHLEKVYCGHKIQ